MKNQIPELLQEKFKFKSIVTYKYTYDMVCTGATEMPQLWYEFENSTHRYFPDIYIPTENLLIEVKSPWTVSLDVDKNQAKFKAVKDAGFDFRLEVRD